MMIFISLFSALIMSNFAQGHLQEIQETTKKETAIVGLQVAKELGLHRIYEKPEYQLAVAKLNSAEKQKLSNYMHRRKRCGGYELVDMELRSEYGPFQLQEQKNLEALFQYLPSVEVFGMTSSKIEPVENAKILPSVEVFGMTSSLYPQVVFDPVILDKIKMVQEDNLRRTVEWISSYPTRRHDVDTKNNHVNEMHHRLLTMSAKSKFPVKIDFIDHSRTRQKSLRARILGSERPDEIVVIGGHFDSINQSFFKTEAPGADDNASGSANVLEAFRIMLTGEQPKRTVEFFWYAAEEVGLVGSGEIASNYRSENKKVMGVLQLDMTLQPGSGESKMVFMKDFTNADLTRFLVDLNDTYVKAKVVYDKCGYGCSDHASWHRQGFPAAMPFESYMRARNRSIHTSRDTINAKSSFKHSANFAKLGVAYIVTLTNK